MNVHLNQIGADGLHLEGQEDSAMLDVQDPLVKPVGPIAYQLDAGISGRSFFATGRLEAPVDFECVKCLRWFRRAMIVEDFAVQVDLTGPEMIDLTPYAREDILLAFPSHPHCDWDGQTECPGVDPVPAQVREQDADSTTWGALDQLKINT